MKILIVNKFLHPNGGSETYIFKIGQQLQRMGHQVQYFGMDHPKRLVGNDWDCYTEYMDFRGNRESNKLKSILDKLSYPFKIIYSREAYRKITYVLERFEPDVVQINNFNFQLTPSILYAIRKFGKKNKKKIPVIVTAHDSQLVCPNHLMQIPATGTICFACRGNKFGNCIRNKCIHNSRIKSILAAIEGRVYKALGTYDMIDLLICPSDFLRRELSTDPVLAKKAVTLHNFVEKGDVEEQIDKEDYILYFGRYSKEKGVENLLEVCRNLPQIPFKFAGSGPLKEEISKVDNIEDKGFLSGHELYRTIAAARLALLPSEWLENCPFSVIEAQMYGTPVLGSNLGGIPELIEAGVTGELLKAGDVAEWTNAIRRLWEDKDRMEMYSSNCRKRSFYTVEEYCVILLRKMEELLQERKV